MPVGLRDRWRCTTAHLDLDRNPDRRPCCSGRARLCERVSGFAAGKGSGGSKGGGGGGFAGEGASGGGGGPVVGGGGGGGTGGLSSSSMEQ